MLKHLLERTPSLVMFKVSKFLSLFETLLITVTNYQLVCREVNWKENDVTDDIKELLFMDTFSKATSSKLYPKSRVFFKLLNKFAMIKAGSTDSVSSDHNCALWLTHYQKTGNLPLYIFNIIKCVVITRKIESRKNIFLGP